ncbi:MAG: hypothetical protein P1V97_09435 [Planctomycetota bacterium]|nr:hypothetical protein [Planctomycetota bacterium]
MTEKPLEERNRTTLQAAKIGVIGSVIAALLGAAVPYIVRLSRDGNRGDRRSRSKTDDSKKTDAAQEDLLFEVTSPKNLEKGKHKQLVTVRGKQDHVPEDHYLWFAVRPDGKEEYSVEGPIELFANGTWSHKLTLGEEKGPLGKYEARVLLVNKKVHEELSSCKEPIRLETLGGESKDGLTYVAEYHVRRK